MKYGGDYLGGKRFERAMLQAHIPGMVGGIFLDTFGYSLSTINAMAASGKFSEIVVHIAPFDRTHRYPINELKKSIIRESRLLEAVSKKYPSVVFLLSPFCEHNHPANKMLPLFNEMKKVAPTCLMLNSISKGQEVNGIITEIHLESSKPKRKPKGEYTVAFDGFGGDGSGDSVDADLSSILQRYSDARHIRIWNFRFNGKFGHKDTAGVNSRTHWPSVDYIKGHLASMKTREGAVTWPKGTLLKPFADDHGESSPTKDNKLMCIVPINKPSVRVFDSNGNQIDTMKRFRPDHSGDPKGPRYYSTKYAYQVADIAQKNTGSRKIRVENLPLTDGDLRSGRFR